MFYKLQRFFFREHYGQIFIRVSYIHEYFLHCLYTPYPTSDICIFSALLNAFKVVGLSFQGKSQIYFFAWGENLKTLKGYVGY